VPPVADAVSSGAGIVHLRHTERRQQRRRRRALWLASLEIDTGPRRIHGAKVVAFR
jgi:hypothetical protein